MSADLHPAPIHPAYTPLLSLTHVCGGGYYVFDAGYGVDDWGSCYGMLIVTLALPSPTTHTMHTKHHRLPHGPTPRHVSTLALYPVSMVDVCLAVQ